MENHNVACRDEAPLMLEDAGLARIVLRELSLEQAAGPCDLSGWEEMVTRIHSCKKEVKVALVGKYTKLHDSYLSVVEALKHGGWECGANVEIQWVPSEMVTPESVEDLLGDVDGILIPGGFGDRGILGMVQAAAYARTHSIPFLGLCLGMQIAAIEFARDVLGYGDANSGEFEPEGAHSVIDLMPDQQGNIPKGGTMRLGAYPCCLQEGTQLREIYGQPEIQERHRHRYEFNNNFREEFQEKGARFAGLSPDGRLVEAFELPDHPFYIGVQYHPEFKSRPNKAHPLFRAFMEAACRNQERKNACPSETL